MRCGCAPTFTSRGVITNRRQKPGAESSPLKAKLAAGKKMRRTNPIAFITGRENAPNEAIGRMKRLHGPSLGVRNAPHEAIGNLNRLCGGHRCQSEIDRTKPNAEIAADQNAPNEAIGKMEGLHGGSLDTRNAPNEGKFNLDQLCGLLTIAENRSK
jgi:hypothetical protein